MPANLSVVNGRSAAAMIGPGATLYKLIAVGTNADQNLIATGKRVVYSLAVSNANAAVRYVKLYNKATAPVVGTDVPVATFALPAVFTFARLAICSSPPELTVTFPVPSACTEPATARNPPFTVVPPE